MSVATPFSFTLPRNATTSAGVFDAQGRLVRTLWRAEKMSAGTQTALWDGNDDNQLAAPAGSYEIRVIHHVMAYQWEGVIGNTSGEFSGSRLHKAYLPPTSLAIVGDQAYYVAGYNEAQNGIHGFRLSAPQFDTRPANMADPYAAYSMVAADDSRLYWANTGGLSTANFVGAVDLSSGRAAKFQAGDAVCLARITPGGDCYPNTDYKSVIAVADRAAAVPTGLSVQRAGRVLAVAHGSRNRIWLYDKVTGEALGSIYVPMDAKGLNQIAFTARGDLWVLSGGSAVRYTNLPFHPTVAATANGFTKPLAVAADPASEDEIWVADGGSSQQLKRVDRNGKLLATFGTAGGYATDPAASTNKFCFSGLTDSEQTGLAVAPDHSVWVIDTCNNRMLRLRSDGSTDAPLAYLPAVYTTTVDPESTRRVFANYLEFEVDDSSPLTVGAASWTLKRNWLAGLPAAVKDARSLNWAWGGFRTVLTMSNGRTYALAGMDGKSHVLELPASGPARFIRTLPALAAGCTVPVLYDNADLGCAVTSNGRQTVLRWPLQGFAANGDPQWASNAVRLADVPTGTNTPHFRNAFTGIEGARFPVTETGKVVFFDQSVVGNEGFHLGAADQGGSSWAWQASPTGALDGRGSFQTRAVDKTINYGGNAVLANGRHVIYGFHGEFYSDLKTKAVGQANQFMHFYDNGLVIGQFGTPFTALSADGAAGMSGNAFSPTLVRSGTRLYLYHNDESAHGGVHRWRIDGWNDVKELKARIDKGSSATLQ